MLHGIPELSFDSQGYIYWNGFHVEHFTHPTSPEMESSAHKLATICRHLDEIGIIPTNHTACLNSQWFTSMNGKHPWKNLLIALHDAYEHIDGKQLVLIGSVCVDTNVELYDDTEYYIEMYESYAMHFDGTRWHRYRIETDPKKRGYRDDIFSHHPLISRGFIWPNAGQSEHLGLCYSSLEGIVEFLERYNVPRDLFDDIPQNLITAEFVDD